MRSWSSILTRSNSMIKTIDFSIDGRSLSMVGRDLAKVNWSSQSFCMALAPDWVLVNWTRKRKNNEGKRERERGNEHTLAIRVNSSNIGYALSSFQAMVKGLEMGWWGFVERCAVLITGLEDTLELFRGESVGFDLMDWTKPGVDEFHFTSGETFGQSFKW